MVREAGAGETTQPVPTTLQLRADLEWRRGNRPACLRALEAAVKGAGESVMTLNVAGALYVQMREIAQAEAVFTRSLAVDKDNPSALSGLSYCLSSQGRYREAAEFALEGVSLLYQHFYSHYCYGIALLHLGERATAIHAFENTLRLQPRFHQARHYLIHLLKHQAGAREVVSQHRSVLLQRGIDHVKTEFRRTALRENLHTSRVSRAAAREQERAAAVARQTFQSEVAAQEFLIVSGLPRSGTSLVMQMLEAAGLPIMTDGVRRADEDNPQGYYEWERMKNLPADPQLISEAAGHVIKVVSPLLSSLPRKHRYKILFLRRDLHEVIRSQNRMRQRLTGTPPEAQDATLRSLEAHLQQVIGMLDSARNVDWIEVRFEELLRRSTLEIDRIRAFCGIPEKFTERMLAVIKDGSEENSSVAATPS